MNKHTPGPWRIGAPPPNGEQTIGNSQGLMVAIATTGAGIPTNANARLISAAPDLLEALQAIVSTCSVRIDDPRIDHFDAARRAIAKAKGERP